MEFYSSMVALSLCFKTDNCRNIGEAEHRLSGRNTEISEHRVSEQRGVGTKGCRNIEVSGYRGVTVP